MSAARSTILKVDGVATAAEAEALQQAGATVIGIELAIAPSGDAGRAVTPDVVRAIRAVLSSATLCLSAPADPQHLDKALAAARAITAGMVQLPELGASFADQRQAIEAAGIQVVLDGAAISYEDDPAWIELRLGKARSWPSALLQLRLLDDIQDPWRHLTAEAPQSPRDYLQLDDIRQLTGQCAALIGIDAQPDELPAIRAALPDARGFVFRLGPGGVSAVVAGLRALDATGA